MEAHEVFLMGLIVGPIRSHSSLPEDINFLPINISLRWFAVKPYRCSPSVSRSVRRLAPPMATLTGLSLSLSPKTLIPIPNLGFAPTSSPAPAVHFPCARPRTTIAGRSSVAAPPAAVDGNYSAKRSSSSEPRETIMLPGCDFNHWLIVMEFPKDPAPTREQMIETYLNTLATVLGRLAFFSAVSG